MVAWTGLFGPTVTWIGFVIQVGIFAGNMCLQTGTELFLNAVSLFVPELAV